MRKRSDWWGGVVSVGIACGAAICVIACDSQKNGRSALPQSTAGASTAAGLSAPKGPFPRGAVDPTQAPDPATTGPAVRIVTPARGAQIETQDVFVALETEDVDGVSAVTVAGAPATPDGANRWIASVPLTAGLNLIEYSAEDGLGNVTTGYLSVAQGQFQSHDELLPRSLGVGFTPQGLSRLGSVAGDLLKNVQLQPLIANANPVLDTTGLKANATQLTHDPLVVGVTGQANGLEVVVDISNFALVLDIDVIGISLTQATITAQPLTGIVHAVVDQSAFTGALPGKHALGLEIDRVDILLQSFDVQASSGFVNTLLTPFRGTLENTFRDKIKTMITDVATRYLQAPLPGVDVPFPIKFPNPLNPTGPQFEVDLTAEIHHASGSPATGLGIVGGLKLKPTTPAPGLTTKSLLIGNQIQAAPPGGAEPFALSLTSDALNKALHAFWAGGALELGLDGTKAPKPGSTLQLTAKLLYPFLPQVRSLAPDGNTPISIAISLGSAPIARIGRTHGNLVDLSIGEVQIKILIDYMDGGAPLELATICAAVELGASLKVTGSELEITNLNVSTFKVDIVREPSVDIADQEIEDFLHASFPMLWQKFQPTIPKLKLPALPLGLILNNVRLDVVPDQLTIFADL